jgi:hypothetical protein
MALFIADGYLDHARNYPDPSLAKYGVGSAGASRVFRADFKGFFDDPVAKQFSNQADVIVDGHIQNGVATFFMLLPKRKPDK